MECIFRMLIILLSTEACACCVSSKNNTTIYACVEEDITLSCPLAVINETVSWIRGDLSKNTITRLYDGSSGKVNYLQSNIAVHVNEEKGKYNLTIKNLTTADNGTYQCLHDKKLTSWLFHVTVKDLNNSCMCVCCGNQHNLENSTCSTNVSKETTGEFKSNRNLDDYNDKVPNMMWLYVMCCGLVASGFAIVSCKYSTLDKGQKGGRRTRMEIIVF